MWWLLVFILLQSVCSWSGVGHDAIGRIAYGLLDSAAVQFLRSGLEVPYFGNLEDAILEAGRWPDQVSDDMLWSRSLHFATTPTRECVGFDLERDCPRCIVSAVANYTMRSLNYNLSNSERSQALRFVIHFMGDIHIPMHVGFKGDSGGNAIAITGLVSKYPVTLHNVWDYHLLQLFDLKALVASVTSVYTSPVDSTFELLSPSDISYATMLNAATSMAFETNRIACTSSYRHLTCNSGSCWIESGDSLEQEYWNANSQVASNQLRLAGIRLATLLNLMAVSSPTNFDSPKSSMHSSWDLMHSAAILLVLMLV